jgi:hypothetical protein
MIDFLINIMVNSLSLITSGTNFTKNPDKYIKYKKDGLTSILSKLYEDNK